MSSITSDAHVTIQEALTLIDETVGIIPGLVIGSAFDANDPVVGEEGIEHSFYTSRRIHLLLSKVRDNTCTMIYMMQGGSWLSVVRTGNNKPVVRHHSTMELEPVLMEIQADGMNCAEFARAAVAFVRKQAVSTLEWSCFSTEAKEWSAANTYRASA